MPRLPESDPIGFLVERKFPIYRSLRIPEPISSSRHSSTSRNSREKSLEEIEAYKAELIAKPRDEVLALYEQEKAKHSQELRAKAEQEEQQRFFNQPSANADFEHWGKAAYWTLDEAVSLAFGKAPEKVTWEKLKQYVDTYNSSPFAKKYARLRDLAHREKHLKQLYDPVLPCIFLVWMKKLQIDIPRELLVQVAAQGTGITDWKDMYDNLKKQHDLLEKQLTQLHEEQKLNKTTNNNVQELLKSNYWQKLEQMGIQVVNEYPAWKQKVGKVQKTGNLQDWLINPIGATNREAEILKKVLSDTFQELQ